MERWIPPRHRHLCSTGFNGATAGMPWKADGSVNGVPYYTKLQWGHGGNAVESARGRRHGYPVGPASMGPRRECRGKLPAPCPPAGPTMLQWGHGGNAVESFKLCLNHYPHSPASMGPRRECRGKEQTRRDRPETDPASMGPRRECRGKTAGPSTLPAARTSFNGATAGMPWKVGPLILILVVVPLLQWGHGGNAVERTTRPRKNSWPTCSFNGATAGMPWKVPTPLDVTFNCPVLQWGHGGNAVESKPHKKESVNLEGFNGATAGMPWKAQENLAGRDGSPASMGPRRECRGKLGAEGRQTPEDCASMGPRRECRGKLMTSSYRLAMMASLQWGHGGNAVERIIIGNFGQAFITLQWGHGGNAVES